MIVDPVQLTGPRAQAQKYVDALPEQVFPLDLFSGQGQVCARFGSISTFF